MQWRFDFSPSTGATPLCFSRPEAEVVAYRLSEVLPALGRVAQAVQEGKWAAGYIAYEAALALDPALFAHPSGALPLVHFGIFDSPQLFYWDETKEVTVGPWTPAISRQRYLRDIETVREHIREGLTYQVNYTIRMTAPFSGDDRTYYIRMLRAQKGPYSAYGNLGRFRILSASPELFFRIDGRRVVTRPMKGTARRGRFWQEDVRRRAALAASTKDQAENVMIVDLLRNDLGRVAEYGSVQAGPLFEIEPYPTVWQMTSTVSATLPKDKTWYDVMLALFPCGSVTGAPKSSTMRIIRDLEKGPRGAYCGTMGYIAPGGDAVFNVAIRTVTLDMAQGIAEFGTGGGITWDSRGSSEYDEMLAKATFLDLEMPDFSLLETLRLEDGVYGLRQYHLKRLERSAEYFRFPWQVKAVEAALDRFARTHGGRWRVRLVYRPDGQVTVEGFPWERPSSLVRRVAWAKEPMPAADPWTFHKTTWRTRYEARHPASSPFFDHLLYNADGQVTEFTRGNVVVATKGALWTPPVESGLLPGTFRQWLLDRHAIGERILTRKEVSEARQIWFINSVRGWVPVSLDPDPS